MPGAVREDAMRIGVSAGGDLYYRDSKIDLGDLRDKLLEGLQNGAEHRVYILVDGRTRYADMKQILDAIRLTELTDISFLTEQTTPPLQGGNH